MNVVTPSVIHEGATFVEYAKNQKPYFPLPASVDGQGTVMTEWEFSAEDLARVLNGGRLRLWLLFTGVQEGRPMIPIALETIEAPQESSIPQR